MARKFVSLILLSNLLLLTCDHGYGIRKTKDPLENDALLMKHSTGDGHDDDHQLTTHDNRHMDHMEDPKLGYVTINDLHVGKTISIHVPTKDPSSLPHFLPRQEADSIPFSVKEFPYLLQLFKISQDSPQAKAVKNTLEDCESKSTLEVTKFCATSLESLVDSVRAIFGSQAPFKALSSTRFTKSDTLLQNYTFLEVKEVSTSMTVACHDLPYPYAVFYCHDLGDTKVSEILVGGERGERATAFFICHMDTSSFSPDHIAFRVLGLKPGTSPVCHYIYPQSLLWVRS